MSDGMLSQDEINALLAGVTGGDDDEQEVKEEKEVLNLSDYISDIEQDALGEIGNISFGSAATALSTLLNQKVDITTPSLSLITRQDLEGEFPQPHVAVHVEYTEGFEGMNLLVIKTTDAAIIADLMLGGDGINPSLDLSEMHVSAVQEAMNQMMGSASTSMSTIFNKKVDISPPGIDLMDIKNDQGTSNLPADSILVNISFRLKVGDLIDSSIMQLVTVSFAKDLVNELMNPSGVEEEIPTYVEEPQKLQEQVEQPIERSVPQPSNHNSMNEVSKAPYEQRGQQHLGHMSTFSQRDVDVQPAAFSTFDSPQLNQVESNNLNMLLDIPLQVTVELGRTKRSIKEILEFTQGSIIELDKLAGEPVDILVNQKLIAKGEVVVIDENFGVRVTDIVSQEDRIRNLK
ncbi:flagellar motor switch phosphatase FliY [Halalkalibacter akibai]|uniref:Flagellar motor switch protein FliN n=1 Tax=Halalkalibacter akibai (strain ATCC 43226 / DSM 21942 / CIP 109018 / JCM 9157 / 1139) TaxID=1236973 RepID=W4QWL6_HALA3|nr:flagellar motor switch phosphatase FliY [Halalkalibacter akibai]GAE36038.1 flagellar motor switch protein FliN [Halalkalibacter akibai JCM 9157]